MSRTLALLIGLQLLYSVGNLGALLQSLPGPQPGSGLRLHSRPEGARVLLGGRLMGVTPQPTHLHPTDFPARLRFELAGYAPLELRLDNPTARVELAPRHAFVPVLYALRDFPLVPAIAWGLLGAFRRWRGERADRRQQELLLAAFERGEPLSGLRVGPYVLDHRLGAGGMAEVWRARHLDGHAVALKMVLPRRLDAEMLARFRREIRIMMELVHPHIVRLDDWGELAGTPYLVMELIEGPTLLERTDGPLPLEEVILYGRQLAEALEAVHAQGAVHRDLKLSNVMLTERGVKLMDFGVGYLGRGGLTRRGETVGTPGHVSPEQLEGRPPTPRSDLYTLGVLLYELVADQPPFMADTVGDLLRLQLQGNPPPPPGPPALSALIMRLLSRDPAGRPATAREVAEELGNLS